MRRVSALPAPGASPTPNFPNTWFRQGDPALRAFLSCAGREGKAGTFSSEDIFEVEMLCNSRPLAGIGTNLGGRVHIVTALLCIPLFTLELVAPV
jgi:hypothetical protein